MYAIYGNMYHQYTPNVSIYTIHGSYGLYIYIYLKIWWILMISIFIVRGISYIHLKILRWGNIKVVNQLFDWLMFQIFSALVTVTVPFDDPNSTRHRTLAIAVLSFMYSASGSLGMRSDVYCYCGWLRNPAPVDRWFIIHLSHYL